MLKARYQEVDDLTVYHTQNHRGNFTTCPSCEAVFSVNKWSDVAVAMTTSIIQGKHAAAAIISECPACSSRSWVHENLLDFEFNDYPAEWKKRAKEELARRRLTSLRHWGAGLCWQCEKLDSGTVNTLAWRNCERGCGPPETECDLFVAV